MFHPVGRRARRSFEPYWLIAGSLRMARSSAHYSAPFCSSGRHVETKQASIAHDIRGSVAKNSRAKFAKTTAFCFLSNCRKCGLRRDEPDAVLSAPVAFVLSLSLTTSALPCKPFLGSTDDSVASLDSSLEELIGTASCDMRLRLRSQVRRVIPSAFQGFVALKHDARYSARGRPRLMRRRSLRLARRCAAISSSVASIGLNCHSFSWVRSAFVTRRRSPSSLAVGVRSFRVSRWTCSTCWSASHCSIQGAQTSMALASLSPLAVRAKEMFVRSSLRSVRPESSSGRTGPHRCRKSSHERPIAKSSHDFPFAGRIRLR